MDADPRIKKSIFLLLICLLVGCQQTGWLYREVHSDCPQYNSAQLKSLNKNAFSGIEVVFLRGNFGILGFLKVCSRQIPSPTLFLKIGDSFYSYEGVLMQGGQTLRLPDIATTQIIETLLSGTTIVIQLEGFATELCPANFAAKYNCFLR